MKQLLLLCFLLFTAGYIFSQDAEVYGVIRDAETSEPLNGANVRSDKTKGTVTDASGKFRLKAPAGPNKITISFIGYKSRRDTLDLIAGETRELNIAMQPAAIQVAQVVSVSQYNKNAARESVTVEVVSQEQIKNTNAKDLSDVINKTPGVLVQDGQISIRGANSYTYGVGSRTLVMQDGLSLMSADLQEGQNNMAALSNVKQVEVVKGASSVVYGAGAINGVVNIISEWPGDAEPRTEVSLATTIYGAPANKYQKWWEKSPFFTNLNINHKQRKKNLQIVAAGNITHDDSYLSENNQFRMQGLFRLRYLHPKIVGLNFGAGGSIQYELSDRFFLSRDLDTNIYRRGAGSGDEYIRTNIDPFVSYQNSKGHRISSFWRYMNIFRNGNGVDPNAVSHQLMTNTQYLYRFKNMLTITTGVPFTIGYSRSNLYDRLNRTFNAAVYLQGEFEYKFLSLQAGGRFEAAGVDTATVALPLFRAGANFRAGKASFFRLSWGQGFRAPSIAEKYIAQTFTSDVLIVPNDTLKTEKSWSMEVGFKQGFKVKNWSAYLDVAFFWQQSANFVEYNLALWDNKWGNGTAIFPDSLEFGYNIGLNTDKVLGLKAQNIENTRIAGYEIGIAGNGNIGPVGLRVLAGYTYIWPTRQDTSGTYSTGEFLKDMFKYNFRRADSAVLPNVLNQRIRHLVRADIELTYWKCYLGATFSYGSAPEKLPALYRAVSSAFFGDPDAVYEFNNAHSKGDFYFDLRAGARVTDNFKVGFIVKNITNRVYALRIGKPEPPRNYTIQLVYNF